MTGVDLPAGVVRDAAAAAGVEFEPVLVLEPLQGYLDRHGIGTGPIVATPVGGGHSNLTFLLERGEERFVLRRPPRGPLPRSAHDVLREARLLARLAPLNYPVPEVLVACEDNTVIGAPFYVMRYLEGLVPEVELPRSYPADAPARIADELVATLADLHEIDVEAAGLTDLGRPSGYLERQLKVFRSLLEANATRPLPELECVAGWLEDNRPQTRRTTLVHGDYRLGNVMFSRRNPDLIAVLDWEMATLGDPLADLGYLVEMWATPEDPLDHPVLAHSPVTRGPGFPGRDELVERYVERTARDVDALPWYRTLALWKASIFLEGNYRRYLAGTTADPYFGTLGDRVPMLAKLAAERAAEA